MRKLRNIIVIFFILVVGLSFPQPPVIAQRSSFSQDLHPSFSLVTLFNQTQNSVVEVTSKTPQLQNLSHIGSGFVYDKNGHIITNSHIVDGSITVVVTSVNGDRYPATVIGADPYTDLAVLQIANQTYYRSLVPLVLGNSSKLKVGEPVVSIGHSFPAEGLYNTLTTGVISQTKYLLSIPEFGVFMPNVIQTDAAINPGNSGGPLLNLQGQVIGISIGRINPVGVPNGRFSGLSVAGPSNLMARIVPALIAKGSYVHPYLGLEGSTLTSDLVANVNGLARNVKGVTVDSILKNGPADKAGIQGGFTDKYSVMHGGDILTAIDGHPVIQVQDLISYIEESKTVGADVTLTILRDGHSLNLTAILAGRPLPPIYPRNITYE